jgi:DNA invertase Pin-like site-specific DNA recombinase
MADETILKDDGLSGATTKRPALLRCLKKLEPCDTLTAWKLNRFSSQLARPGEHARQLPPARHTFQVTHRGHEHHDTKGELVFHMFTPLAELSAA